MRRRGGIRGTAVGRGRFLIGLALLLAGFAPPSARADTQLFSPVADSYVSAAKPGANYGGQSRLKVDASPVLNSYLRFDVQLPTGAAVSAASLELAATGGSSGAGFAVDAVADSSWGEYTLTYLNAPSLGSQLGAAAPWSTAGYQAVPLPVATLRAGLNSFAATSANAFKALTFYSRESASPPRLRVTYTLGPAPPSNLTVTSASQTSISVAWTASPDPSTSGYDLYLNGAKVGGTSTGTSYSFTGLSCGTSYTVAVDAYDSAGNRSAAAGLTTATSACPADITPPSAPSKLAVTGTSASSITLAWSASNDNVGVTGYDLYVNGKAIGTTTGTSYSFTGFSCGTSYTLGVDAYDAAGNRSAAAALSASTSACPAANVAPAPLVPASGAYFGAWVKDATVGWWTQQGLLDFEAMVGRKVGVDHHYYRWDETFPTSAESWDLQNGRIPMVSLGGASTFPGLDAINDGSQDARLHAIAQGFRSLGGEVFFRPWWEMNGDWYPWDGSHNNDPGTTDGPAKYVQAWRRMHDIFVQEGATNVVWVWAPDAEDSPSAGWNHWANYYPGDAYVDWVGIDGYNWGTTQTWSSWQSFASIFGNVYGDYAASKPLMVAETSSCEQGGDKAQWIRDAAAAIKTQLTAIRAWIWFDENVECDWRVNTSQSALDAYKQVGADPYFNPGVASSGDTQAPSAPASLAVTSTSTSSIALSWSASSDNVGVAGYNVYANGTRIATTTSTSYSFTGLSCGTSYTLAVDAYDAAGNRSSASSVTAATSACPADTSPPTAPANLAVTGTGASSIALSWGASSDNVAVTGYDVYLNSTKIATTTQTGYSFTGLNCGSSYTLGVDAYDAAGNVSSRSTLTAATSACAATSGPCGTATTPPATYQHVIWIWMENKAYGEIIGSSSAPYENSLANQCGLATNYSAITHPSLPNYIAATSGDYWGISDDNPPSSHPLSVGSIYSQVKAAGKSWRDYEENAPGNCPLDSSYPYAVKHDPAPYYTNIRTDCANWDVPMGTTSGGNFLNDLNNNSLPAFSFITPDLCNDTHDCAVSTGDDWLASWLPKIFASSAYQSGSTAVFITWDEDDGSTSNHVATIVASAYTPAGTRSSTAYNHYSLLRTTEQLLGINTYLAHAGDTTTNSMRTDFHL